MSLVDNHNNKNNKPIGIFYGEIVGEIVSEINNNNKMNHILNVWLVGDLMKILQTLLII